MFSEESEDLTERELQLKIKGYKKWVPSHFFSSLHSYLLQ